MRSPGQKILSCFDRDFSSVVSVQKVLKQNGFVRIGYGSYTSAYGKKGASYVIKINEQPDPPAFKFYSMILNENSKYFPKVYKLKSFVDTSGDFLFIAIVEKLHELNQETWQRANDDGRSFACWINSHRDAEINVIKTEPNYRQAGSKWKRTNAPVVKILSSIINTTAKFAYTDFSDGNMMVRLPTGDIVLNDPIFPNDEL